MFEAFGLLQNISLQSWAGLYTFNIIISVISHYYFSKHAALLWHQPVTVKLDLNRFEFYTTLSTKDKQKHTRREIFAHIRIYVYMHIPYICVNVCICTNVFLNDINIAIEKLVVDAKARQKLY